MRARHGRFPERERGHARIVVGYAALLVAASAYVLLDTFVITRGYAMAEATGDAEAAIALAEARDEASEEGAASDQDMTRVVESAFADDAQAEEAADATAVDASEAAGVSTRLSQTRYLDTTVYVVDVYADEATDILAAFAQDTYGRNVTAKTSEMAEAQDATVAINGDYYGARNAGYVVRNGVLYRDTVASADQEDLVIYANGDFEVVCEGDVSAQELVDAGAWQVYSFGPGLVIDGSVAVAEGEEVGRAKASNPRTAIGKVSDGHYVLVVADGRTDESAGLSLSELATFLVEELGVECAYNLDGGGSSTLWYEGEVVNNPTSSGRSTKERSVSDIVYVGA